MVDNVPLRFSRRARLWLFWQAFGLLVFCVLVGGVQSIVRGQNTFLVGVYIGLGIWALIVLIQISWQYHTIYRIRGDALVAIGRHPGKIDLPSASVVRLEVLYSDRARKHPYLTLCVDSRQIKLGERRMPSYYAADGLRRLAAILERSPQPEARDGASRLRALADHPVVDSWPEAAVEQA